MNNCENCGAPLHGNICEYCGSEKHDYSNTFTYQSILNQELKAINKKCEELGWLKEVEE